MKGKFREHTLRNHFETRKLSKDEEAYMTAVS
jgi:hypothetical protein